MNNIQLSGKTDYLKLAYIKERLNYLNGDLLPFINVSCRKDMTTGDIDGFEWDYKKKVFRFLEAKRSNESQKDSQYVFYNWLQNNIIIKDQDYDFEVFRIRGDPPYDKSEIFSYKTKDTITNLSHDELRDFLDMKLSFKDLYNKK